MLVLRFCQPVTMGKAGIFFLMITIFNQPEYKNYFEKKPYVNILEYSQLAISKQVMNNETYF